MTWMSKRDRHTRLVGRLAEALGIDLEEARQRGDLPEESMDDAVEHCMGCDDPTSCEEWLRQQSEPAEAPPAYCRNTRFLNRLR